MGLAQHHASLGSLGLTVVFEFELEPREWLKSNGSSIHLGDGVGVLNNRVWVWVHKYSHFISTVKLLYKPDLTTFPINHTPNLYNYRQLKENIMLFIITFQLMTFKLIIKSIYSCLKDGKRTTYQMDNTVRQFILRIPLARQWPYLAKLSMLHSHASLHSMGHLLQIVVCIYLIKPAIIITEALDFSWIKKQEIRHTMNAYISTSKWNI